MIPASQPPYMSPWSGFVSKPGRTSSRCIRMTSKRMLFAPVACGLPEGDVVHALPDLAEQLDRFRRDEQEGKIPDDLTPLTYGPNAWLLARRKPLVTTDAVHDVESTFVRRHKVRGMIGLPLEIGTRIVGLLYFDYVPEADGTVKDVSDPDYLARVTRLGNEVATVLDAARHAEEAEVLRGMSDLISDFGSLSVSAKPETARRLIEDALRRLLAVVDLGGAALYAADSGTGHLTLFASEGISNLSSRASTLHEVDRQEIISDPGGCSGAVVDAGLTPLVCLAPSGPNGRSALVLADRDPLALHRRLPAEHTLLQAAADLLGGMLETELLDALDDRTARWAR